MLSRRKFLKYSLAGAGALALGACNNTKANNTLKIKFRNDNSSRAHTLRNLKQEFKTEKDITTDIVIIGAGISGLSAALNLKNNGCTNFIIYELSDSIGGNAASGKNNLSEYPYGAHYLTLPNPANKELIDFLHNNGIIKGFDEQNRPIYNETDLCFDPEERLFIRGVFQEGLIPDYGLDKWEKKEFTRFFELIKFFKEKKGNDGNYFFEMPSSKATKDISLNYLDEITFAEYLKKQNYHSKHLLWYLNYCCRDDYGGGIEKVSAWAGINYFASHRSVAANTDAARVLTWPAGNGHLVNLFQKELGSHIRTSVLVQSVSISDNQVNVQIKNFDSNTIANVFCKQCIVAVPPFVASRIISTQLNYPFTLAKQIEHSPWLVATVTLTHLNDNRQLPVCWDNVAYGAKSLGYIHNQHQHLKQLQEGFCITLYMPLDDDETTLARKKAAEKDELFWKKEIVEQLEELHNGITNNITEIEICIWGHGMVLPKPGLTKGGILNKLSADIESKVFFAHTDLSGYSVFEEAFDQGIRASQKIIQLKT